MQNENILILGAGPAGMTSAMELHNAGKKSIIIEKNNQVGGLAKTLQFTDNQYTFRTDIGPHRFFSKNKYLYDFIEELLEEKWLVVKRRTRQFIDGKYYDYPVNALQAFRNIGISRAMGMGFSYLNALITYRLFKKKIENFEDYVVANFGRQLGEFNMLNYTEKIWGVSCKELHPDWAKQRIKGLNLRSALKNALFKKNNQSGPKTLVDQFYYPQFGTGLIYETIAQKIQQGGSQIKTNSYPTQIKFDNNHKITEVELNVNGQKTTIQPAWLISSIPITQFIQILHPAPPKEIIQAANKLRWRSQVYLFITLDRERITHDNWIYFPNKEIPFGRISEMKNFSQDMSPPDKTSLFVEFFVTENDALWNMQPDKIFNLAMSYLEKLKLLSKKDVRTYRTFRKKHVYPVYDLNYPAQLKLLKQYLDQFSNLLYIGRLGRFQYTNQDHSLEMGILAAKSVLDNQKSNFDDIGSEKEYFERGLIKI
jgi:protoporphyrinogen oxidase